MLTICCVYAKNATCNRQQPDPSQLPPGHTSKRNLHTCLCVNVLRSYRVILQNTHMYTVHRLMPYFLLP